MGTVLRACSSNSHLGIHLKTRPGIHRCVGNVGGLIASASGLPEDKRELEELSLLLLLWPPCLRSGGRGDDPAELPSLPPLVAEELRASMGGLQAEPAIGDALTSLNCWCCWR